MNNRDLLTGTEIERRFLVIPETGDIYNIFNKDNHRMPCGCIKPGTASTGGGYRMIGARIGGKSIQIRAHHLVWCWVYGEWPNGEIDHINNDRADNRISNLRLASVSQNRMNKGVQSNNKSGFKWVYKCCQTGKWRAEVSYRENGKKKKFRSHGHDTPDAAYEIASNFAKSAHGTFYNPGKM